MLFRFPFWGNRGAREGDALPFPSCGLKMPVRGKLSAGGNSLHFP